MATSGVEANNPCAHKGLNSSAWATAACNGSEVLTVRAIAPTESAPTKLCKKRKGIFLKHIIDCNNGSSALSVEQFTLRHRQSEKGIVSAMMTYDNIVSRKPQKLFSMTTALSTTSIGNIDRITRQHSLPDTTVKLVFSPRSGLKSSTVHRPVASGIEIISVFATSQKIR